MAVLLHFALLLQSCNGATGLAMQDDEGVASSYIGKSGGAASSALEARTLTQTITTSREIAPSTTQQEVGSSSEEKKEKKHSAEYSPTQATSSIVSVSERVATPPTEQAEWCSTHDIDLDHLTGQLILAKYQRNISPLLAVIKHLSEKEGNLNAQDSNGLTILNYAVINNELAIVKFLVEVGKVDLDALIPHKCKPGEHVAPIHNAIEHDSFDVVEYLVSANKIDVNLKNIYGQTVLHTAAKHGKLTLVKWLLDQGMDINLRDRYGFTAWEYSVKSGNVSLVKFLVEKGYVAINASNKYGNNAAHHAANTGDLEMVQCLAEQGINIKKKTEDGSTTLHYAVESGKLTLVAWLVKSGVAINACNNFRGTALHRAVVLGNFPIVHFLVENKADVTVHTKNGDTALHIAVNNSGLAMIKLLVEFKADINARNNSRCIPLHKAAYNSSLPVVQYLIKLGADVDMQDDSGTTSLHRAIGRNIEKSEKGVFFCYLLERCGAHTDIKNNNGETAFEKAIKDSFKPATRAARNPEQTAEIQDYAQVIQLADKLLGPLQEVAPQDF